jgi:hypothetical protein
LRPVFERWVVLDNAQSPEALIQGQVIERIERPARILRGA